MGWTSTADPYENVGRAALSFDSSAAAAAFCEAHGWAYTIRPPAPVSPNARPKRYLQYGDNFSVRRNGIPEGGLVSENGNAAGGGGGGGGAAAAAAAPKRGGGRPKKA
jgi:NADH dehydrogenase (ubiquinone) Fe-S protein 4